MSRYHTSGTLPSYSLTAATCTSTLRVWLKMLGLKRTSLSASLTSGLSFVCVDFKIPLLFQKQQQQQRRYQDKQQGRATITDPTLFSFGPRKRRSHQQNYQNWTWRGWGGGYRAVLGKGYFSVSLWKNGLSHGFWTRWRGKGYCFSRE